MGSRILIIDNEPEPLLALACLIRSAGHEVLEASSGNEGLRLAKEEQPDVILIDVALPDADGSEVCRQIKADPETAGIYVTLVSGIKTASDCPVNGLEGGADDYVACLASEREMLARVEAMLRLVRAEKALQEANAALEAQIEHRTAELERSLQYWQTTFDALNDSVSLIDPDGHILECNAAMSRLLGKPRDQIVGQTWWDLVHGMGAPIDECPITRMRESGARESAVVPLIDHWFMVTVDPILKDDEIACAVHVIADITDRVRTEQELSSSRQLLEQTFASIRDAIIVLDADNTEIVDCNEAACAMFGYTASEMFGRTPEFLHVDEDTLQEFREHLYATVEAQGFLEGFEFRMKRRDGSVFVSEHAVTPLVDRDGRRTGWVSVIRDITERIQTEQALRESEERFRQLADNVSEVFYVYDPAEDRFLYVSPAYEQVWQRPVQAVYDDPLDFTYSVHPDDRAAFVEAVRKEHEESVYFNLEYRINRPDSTMRWLWSRNSPVRDAEGNVYRVVGIAEDVTERRVVLDRLRESEERFRSLASTAPVGVFEADVHGNSTYVNSAICRFTGLPPEAHMSDGWVSAVHPEDREWVVEEWLCTVAGEGEFRTEFRFVSPGGTVTWVASQAASLMAARGVRRGFIGTLTDITERKQVEKALRLDEARLEAIVELGQMTEASAEEIADHVLAKAVELTESEIGFIGFMDESESGLDIHAWSRRAMVDCSVVDARLHFPIAEAGIWGEAVRQRQPVLVNDYVASSHPRKRGVPEGHVGLTRLLTVPVFERERIVSVVAVGNKGVDYDQSDVRQLTLLTDGMWKLVQRRRSEQALQESELKFRLVTETIGDVFWMSTCGVGEMVYVSPAYEVLWQRSRKSLYQSPRSFLEALHPHDLDGYLDVVDKYHRSGKPYGCEYRIIRGDGEIRWIHERGFPVSHDWGGTGLMAGLCTDITDRKRVEQDLAGSRDSLARAQQIGHLGSWDWDVANETLTWSDELYRIFGVEREHFALTYDAVEATIHPDDQELNAAMVDRMLETGRPCNYEFRIVRPDGEVRHIHQSLETARDDEGRVTRAFGIMLDVTDRKRAEEQARLRTEGLLSVGELAVECAAASPEDDLYGLIADKLLSTTGAVAVSLSAYDASSGELVVRHIAASGRLVRALNEILGRAVVGLRIPVSAQMMERMLRTVVTTKESVFEVMLGAVPRPVAAAVQRAMPVGGFTGLALCEGRELYGTIVIAMPRGKSAFPVDLAESVSHVATTALRRRHAQKALLASQRELARTLQATTEGIWTWRFSTDQLAFSPRYYQMLGYVPDAFPATYENWVDLIHPEDRERALAVAEEYLQTKPDEYESEFRLRCADGSYRWIRARGRVVERDGDGEAVYMIGNHEDVTERRQAEEALRSSLERAEHQQQLLHALAQAAQVVQRARSPEDVFLTIHDEIARLGYSVAVLTVSEDRSRLVVSHIGVGTKVIQAAEKLTELSAADYAFPLIPDGFYDRLLHDGRVVFSDPGSVPIAEALPGPFAKQLAGLLHLGQAIYAPLVVDGEVQSLMTVIGTDLRADDVPVVRTFVHQASIALENARLLEQLGRNRADLRQLSAQLVHAQEEERGRISRELHDEMGQALTAMAINLAEVERSLSDGVSAETRERLTETAYLVEHTLDQVRELSLSLRPSLLDDLGLEPALRWYLGRASSRSGIEVVLETLGLEERLPGEVETTLYRVIQEAMTNVTRHAEAERVVVSVACEGGAVRASIEDDGRGFHVQQQPEAAAPLAGVGLLGMQERVAYLGGRLSVWSTSGKGTHLRIEIPLEENVE